MNITITDTIGDSGSVTVEDASDIADAIRPWYDGLADGDEQIAVEIEEAINGLDPRTPEHWGYAAYLGVSVDYADEDA